MFPPFFPLQSSLNSAFHLFIIHINNFRLLLWIQINFIIHNIDNLRLLVSSLHKVLTLFIGVLQELDNHTVKKWDYISARANQSKKAQPFQFSVSCCEKNDFTQIMFYKSVFFLRLFLFEFVRHCLDCLLNLSSSSSSSISRCNLYSKKAGKRNTWFDFAYSQSAFLSIKDRFDWIFRLDCWHTSDCWAGKL